MRNHRPQTDLGRVATWAAGDEEGAAGDDERTPVKYVGDTPDDRWRDVLTWLFLPSIVGALSLWVLLHSWFNLSSVYAGALVGIDLVLYMLIGWRGRQLFLFATRFFGRGRGSTQ